MVFGALPQELLCGCTKESAFALFYGDYTAVMGSVDGEKKDVIPENIEQLADEFLDLWQDNIRLWAEERDLFTLQNFIETLKKQLAEQAKRAAQ